MLSDLDGLIWQGPVTDRAGRLGVAVTMDSDHGGTRDTLIFDPYTGRLLAYDLTYLRNPPGYHGPTPRSVSYTLYLDHGRRTQADQP
jgi:hypothetical protein